MHGPVHGRVQVARFVLGLVRYAATHGWQIARALVNDGPGARVLDEHGNVVAVLAVQIADGRVQSLYNVVNPDKLSHVAAGSEIAARRRPRSGSANEGDHPAAGDP